MHIAHYMTGELAKEVVACIMRLDRFFEDRKVALRFCSGWVSFKL